MVASPHQRFELEITAALRSRLSQRRLFFARLSTFGNLNQTPTLAGLILHAVCLIVLLCLMFPVRETGSFLYILLLGNLLIFVNKIIRFNKSKKS